VRKIQKYRLRKCTVRLVQAVEDKAATGRRQKACENE
jgi:hypothetical protein